VIGLLTFVPESPLFLIKKGRIAEARAILTRIARFNNKSLMLAEMDKDIADDSN